MDLISTPDTASQGQLGFHLQPLRQVATHGSYQLFLQGWSPKVKETIGDIVPPYPGHRDRTQQMWEHEGPPLCLGCDPICDIHALRSGDVCGLMPQPA